MESKSAVKVGLMVIIGGVLLFSGWWYLAHLSFNRHLVKVAFNNTGGLLKQTPVRMNGVNVGEVHQIALDPQTLQPIVTLSLDNSYRIPSNSRIHITSGLLISNPQIEIIPGKSPTPLGNEWPQQYVESKPPGPLASISPEANRAIQQLSNAMQELTPHIKGTFERLDGILKHTDSIMSNLQNVTMSARNLIADPKIARTRDIVLGDLQAVSRDARQTANSLSLELRSIVKRNSGKIDALGNRALDLLDKFADTVDAARGAVTRLTDQVSDPRLQQSLVETINLAKATLARFDQVASDIHQLAGDPSVQSDIKSTVSTLKETSEDGQHLIERLNTLVGKFNVQTGKHSFGLSKPNLSIDFLLRSSSPHIRSDVNLREPVGSRNAIDLGIYDFAENNRLNLQYETKLSGFGALRYGIYASKLAVGLDWPTSGATRFSLDAFNPNSLQIDARGLIQLNNDFSLWIGADDVFRRTTPLIGVRLQR